MQSACPNCKRLLEEKAKAGNGNLIYKCKCGTVWVDLDKTAINLVRQED